MNVLSLSFIAEYIGKVFEEVKQRPLYVVSKLMNFDSAASEPPRSLAPPNWSMVSALAPPRTPAEAEPKGSESAAE